MSYTDIALNLVKFDRMPHAPKEMRFSATTTLGYREEDGDLVSQQRELVEKNPSKAMHHDFLKAVDQLIPHFSLIMGLWRPDENTNMETWMRSIYAGWTHENRDWLHPDMANTYITQIAWTNTGLKLKASIWIPYGDYIEIETPDMPLNTIRYTNMEQVVDILHGIEEEAYQYLRGTKFHLSEFVQLEIFGLTEAHALKRAQSSFDRLTNNGEFKVEVTTKHH